MKRTIGAGIAAALFIAFFSCATEKPKAARGYLDFDLLVGAEDSTYLPFEITKSGIAEIKELFARDNLPPQPYKLDFSAKTVVPADVKYREIPLKENQRRVNEFFNNLKPPIKLGKVQDNKVIICGPYLSAILKKGGILKELEHTKINGSLIFFHKQDVLVEYAIKAESLPRIYIFIRNLLFCDGEITVRKLNPRELDWYWVSNSYQIDEPIYVFQNSAHKVMIHFNPEGQIFFLELFDTLTWQVPAAK